MQVPVLGRKAGGVGTPQEEGGPLQISHPQIVLLFFLHEGRRPGWGERRTSLSPFSSPLEIKPVKMFIT